MMEIAFLLLLCVLEAAFAARTFFGGRDKGKWYKERNIARAVELGCFFLFLLLPAVHFDFRFRLCFWLLVVRLVLAFIAWMRWKTITLRGAAKHLNLLCGPAHNKENGTLTAAGLICRLAGTVLVFTVAMIPAFVFTGYEGLDTTGAYQVKQAQAILVDNGREEHFEQDGSKREVPVYFYYPDVREGTFPLVVFSHGAFGWYQSNMSTYMELAGNGYVVVSLDHPYHSLFTKDTAGKTVTVNPEFLGEVQYINQDTASEEEVLALSSKWLSLRTADMNFVLDTIKEAKDSGCLTEAWHTGGTETAVLQAVVLADCEKTGVMGHSLGGAAAVSLGRARDDIGAVIDLDGTMLGEELAYAEGAYVFEEEPYPVPLLSIDNEEHHELAKEAGTAYVNAAVLGNAKDGRNCYFKGSGHLNFTDLPMYSPFLAGLLGTGSIDSEACIRQMNGIILQYFNYYLKGEGEIILQECYE